MNSDCRMMRMEKPPIHGASTTGSKPITTFVHTNSSAFREVVQRLTGPSDTTTEAKEEDVTTKISSLKKTTIKLHERRKYMKPKLEIVKPTFQYKSASSSPGSKNYSFPPSPGSGCSSILPCPITPSRIFSKLTLFEDEKIEDSAKAELNNEEEEKAIRERRFYLHPSPRSKQGFHEPELLSLFPLASPNTIDKV
ncbi:unnamed protein product [Lupinus luteus]|uniref:VQ domain-containing protein n=1 Tax=Lupinus luteus TaxID=3873 RepID=A0AAV1WC59_LUPLU